MLIYKPVYNQSTGKDVISHMDDSSDGDTAAEHRDHFFYAEPKIDKV